MCLGRRRCKLKCCRTGPRMLCIRCLEYPSCPIVLFAHIDDSGDVRLAHLQICVKLEGHAPGQEDRGGISDPMTLPNLMVHRS